MFFQYAFVHSNESADLPSDISDAVQDKDGFLWLATTRGLARYDGLEMDLYRISRYPNVLSNQPSRVFVDTQNRLFIASQRGRASSPQETRSTDSRTYGHPK